MCILMYFIYDVLVKRKVVVKVYSFHVFAKLYDITKWRQIRMIWCCQTVFIAMLIFFTTAIWFKNERIQLLTVSLLQSGKNGLFTKTFFSIRHRCKRRIHRAGIMQSPVQSYRSLQSFWIYSTNEFGIYGRCLIRPTQIQDGIFVLNWDCLHFICSKVRISVELSCCRFISHRFKTKQPFLSNHKFVKYFCSTSLTLNFLLTSV